MKSKALKIILIVIGVIFALGIIAAIFDDGSTDGEANKETSETQKNNPDQTEAWTNKPATDGLEYKLSEDKASYSAAGLGSVSGGSIVIADTYQGKPVTAIQAGAFKGTNVTEVHIPDTVMRIGDGAFSNCSQLKSVNIAPSVKEIGIWAFWKCANLSECTLPSKLSRIGQDAFDGCDKLIQIDTGVAYVGNWIVDFDNNIDVLILKDGTVGIADKAFYGGNNLEKITLPTSLRYIGDDAFDGCKSLEEICIYDIAAWCNIDFENYPSDTQYSLFLNGEQVVELIIPDGVTTIPTCAFDRCVGIKTMSVPVSVTAFLSVPYGCDTITYNGTVAEWDAITRYKHIFEGVTVNCTDGIGNNTIVVETE